MEIRKEYLHFRQLNHLHCNKFSKSWQNKGYFSILTRIQNAFSFQTASVVDSGDGDYLTVDTLWDFKVTKSKPTNKHTLQLLMYWIMGQHSGQEVYKNIQNLGVFNPRLNVIYLLDIKSVSEEIIAEVERDIICY